jgi:hypothetical protein
MEENFKNLKEEDYGSVLISGETVHVGSHRNICQPPVKGNWSVVIEISVNLLLKVMACCHRNISQPPVKGNGMLS